MKKILTTIAITVSLLSAEGLKTFESGAPATAIDVNANFEYLKNLLLQQQIEINALKQNESPIGAIIASMQVPEASGYLSDSQVWYNCVGGSSINGVTIPDLRGVFLRGLDQGSGRDEDGLDRIAGSYQEDEFKRHTHTANMKIGAEPTYGGARSVRAAGGHGSVTPTYETDGLVQFTGGSETRSENVAVYYYIKVK